MRPGRDRRPGLIAFGETPATGSTDVTTLAPVATTELSEALLEGMARTPLFEGASEETISRLAAQGVSRRFRRGTYLFHQGDDAPDVYFLVSGRVEISSLSSNGHRQLHTTLDVPQFFGELGVLGDQPRSAAALALEETEAWRVSGLVLLDFLIEEPTAARALLRALARQVLSQEAFVEDLLYLDLKGRVAKRLLQRRPGEPVRREPGERHEDPVRLPAPGHRRARRQAVRVGEDLGARQARRPVNR